MSYIIVQGNRKVCRPHALVLTSPPDSHIPLSAFARRYLSMISACEGSFFSSSSRPSSASSHANRMMSSAASRFFE